jgi:GLPGLI family protein
MRRFFLKNSYPKVNMIFAIRPKQSYYIYLFIITTITLTIASCTERKQHNNISEGEIEYYIEYLDNDNENPLIMLLPKKMTTLFNNNSSCTLIEGFLGTFKLTYVSNSLINQNYSLFQIMDKKYYYQAGANELSFGYEKMEDLKIVFTDVEKKIAGYNCNQAIASFPGGQYNDIEIFYTKEINLKKPNQNNPFRQIDGVLMEFTVNLMGINMKIKTKKVHRKKIKPEIFEIPKGYSRVTLEEMEKIVSSFNLNADK